MKANVKARNDNDEANISAGGASQLAVIGVVLSVAVLIVFKVLPRLALAAQDMDNNASIQAAGADGLGGLTVIAIIAGLVIAVLVGFLAIRGRN